MNIEARTAMPNNEQNRPNDPKNAPRSGDQGAAKNPSGTKPAGENRPQSREGVDAPRTEQNRPAGKPAPHYDDRPGQQRGGGSAESQDPNAPLPNTKTPNYGDKEPGDPRRLDVESAGREKTGDRKQSGGSQGDSAQKGNETLGGRSGDSTSSTGSRGKNS
jgi:hypothetical protein